MLSKADIRIVEQVLTMEPVEQERFLTRLSAGAQDLLDVLLAQYAAERCNR